MPNADTTPTFTCKCDQCLADSLSSDNFFGIPTGFFCFQHQVVTPQAKKMLAFVCALDCAIYPMGVVGKARVGKSFLCGKIHSKLCGYIPSNFNFSKTETFKTSNLTEPCTQSIDFTVLPRFCNNNLEQLNSMDGVFFLYDVEGQDHGTNLHHTAMLGITSRITSHMVYMNQGNFDHECIRGLGNIVAANMLGDVQKNGNVSATSLSLIVNMCILAMPADGQKWVRDILTPRDSVSEDINNCIRAVNKTWPSLSAGWIPAAESLESKKVVDAVTKVVAEVIPKIKPLTMAQVLGLSDSSLNTALSADTFTEFVSQLVKGYNGNIPSPKSAIEVAVRHESSKLLAKQIASYETLRKEPPYSFAIESDDVDGARGTADDTVALNIRDAVVSRHDQLAKHCENSLVQHLKSFDIAGAGTAVADTMQALKTELQKKKCDLVAHWDHQRAFDLSKKTVEKRSGAGDIYCRVVHEFYVRGKRRQLWQRYQTVWSEKRSTNVRNNGDIVVDPDWALDGEVTRKEIGTPYG
eukprot:comp15512_c0_seq1/m.23687 comp15512_c0_seq1/g.23687  ORF comp15512_c0_seq1/g.23687 comp15512_c0_seq1/m.23687 type:complete len:523 (-) comp15512_c0_seq1:81-1649(-)